MAKKFITIDCETDPFKYRRLPVPFLWGTYDGVMFRHFDKTEDIVDYLSDKDVIAYAHNGGKFDFFFLLKHFNTWDRIRIINGRIVSIKLGDCELRDSYALIHEPLEAYKKTKVDSRIFEADKRIIPANREKILSYLADDCIFLYELITDIEKTSGRHLTLASSCMATWEKISKRKPPQSSKDFFYQFAAYYFGGRVECFKSGYIEMPGEVVDIKSAYASTMLSKHPYGLDYIEIENEKDFRDTDFIEIEAISDGALPWRDERGSMHFPNDSIPRIYFATGHELRAAIETKTINILKYNKIYRFDDLLDFTPYIMENWQLRKLALMAGEQGKQLVYKRKMNGLYGKFAANPDNYSNFILVHPDEHDTAEDDGFEFAGMMGPYYLMSSALEENEERYYNVACAASITGQVRAKLWRAICASDDPIYCDTDCVFSRRSVVDIGSELGQWEREGTFERAWIVGKKMYLVEGDFGIDKSTGKKKTSKQASKGVKLKPAEIKKAALGKTVTYYPEAPTFSILRPAGDNLKKTFPTRKVRATARASR
jgi:hypothetical protein